MNTHLNNQDLKMSQEQLDQLRSIVRISDLPVHISKVYYQPTTGRFFKDNDEIEVKSITVIDISPIARSFIIERDKKVVVSKRVEEGYYNAEELAYAKEMLEQEGYICYETNSLSFAANIEYHNVERTKREVIVDDKIQSQLAIINVNSGTQLPEVAFGSLIKALEDGLKESSAVAEITLAMKVSDEPFTTKNTNRQIFQIDFEVIGETNEDVLNRITRKKNGTLVAQILSDKLKEMNKATFSSLADVIVPLKIEGIDVARLAKF
jgi:transcriptional regulator